MSKLCQSHAGENDRFWTVNIAKDEVLADFEETGDAAFMRKCLTTLERAITIHEASLDEKLIQSAKEALAIAEGKAEPRRSISRRRLTWPQFRIGCGRRALSACPMKRRFWTTRAGIDNFAQARQHMVQNGENVVFDFGDERLIVEHTKIGQLYDDMIFG